MVERIQDFFYDLDADTVAEFISNCIDKVLLLFFIIIFLMGAYGMYDTYYVYNKANDDSVLAYKPRGILSEEKDLPENMIAWITVDNTKIDYPIMQADDNVKYLNTNPYGEYSLSGSIFLDFRNNKEFLDSYSLLYGHHMEGKLMFGALDDFLDEDFLKTHKKGTLQTLTEVYDLNIFASVSTNANEMMVFDPKGTEDRYQWIKENADVLTTVKPGNIVALSTCAEINTTVRTVVFATIQRRE